MSPEIFISHSTADKLIAERVCGILEKHGLTCWIAPRDVSLGASWPASILHAIEAAKAFVLVLSPSANLSPYVVSEVNLAFSHRKTIFVLRTEDISPIEDLQFFLGCPQWTDVFPPPIDDHLTRMAGAMRLLLGKDQLKPAAGEPAPRACALREPRTVVKPPPVPPPPGPPPPIRRGETPPATSVFDEKGRLRLAAFGFAIDGILLRAARRRNDQQRVRASVADLTAGLLRTGGMTRLVMQQLGLDPDELYAKLRATPEAPSARETMPAPKDAALNDGTVPDAAQLQAMLARWILHRKDDFTPELADLLDSAAAGNGLVTEQSLLERLIDTPAWNSPGAGLPTAGQVRAALEACTRSRCIDGNGAVPLHYLAPAAREIVQRAHLLSQQCQSATITHRLLLASLIANGAGFAARVCRQAGVDTGLLQPLLVTMSSGLEPGDSAAGANVMLSPAVCARIVSPVLAQARQDARDPENVSEAELFRAFCRVADPSFRQFLSERSEAAELETLEADLEELMHIDPDRPDRLGGLTLRARQVVRQAHALTRNQGLRVIPNRFLMAAFLEREEAEARRRWQARSISAQMLHDLLLKSAEPGTAAPFDLDDEACSRIVTPVLARARTLAAATGIITESLLFRAFCEVSDAGFRAALRDLGVNLSSMGSGQPDIIDPRLWGPN